MATLWVCMFFFLEMAAKFVSKRSLIKSRTVSLYWLSLGLFTEYSPLIYLIINSESPMMETLLAPILLANCNPRIRASYSVMLLVHLKFNIKACPSAWLFSILWIHTPAPSPNLLIDPSKSRCHSDSLNMSSLLVVLYFGSLVVISLLSFSALYKIKESISECMEYMGKFCGFSSLLTMYFIKVSLYNFLSWPKIDMVAQYKSNCKDPYSFAPHEQDNSIQYFGEMSTTTKSIRILFAGHLTRVTHKSLIKPRHLSWLESKENKSLYGLVMSRFNLSIISFGIKLWDALEYNIALCNILSWMFRLK